ncbi:protein-tyrosine phosphatase family protein [Pseudalkalibacillus caeni]|uniref:Dual specificity protein phosphatase family protein n=1 Tax=Exobacillus caeni TaxID=2574798 RepID=A0A5R9EYC1_9BACL|nr:dual specificity protein phosphatase [Pseudalkalibacillus caeni]TLS35196.1 dual specificity protein phosphatase family protein [Pseudalkalibacillus caeni]
MPITEIIPNRLYAGSILEDGDWIFVNHRINAILNVSDRQYKIPINFINRILLYAPILDQRSPDLHWLITVINTLQLLLTNGYVVYVHDVAGINRLGFILTAYFMKLQCWPQKEALQFVKKLKPDLAPKPWYIKLLNDYERYLFSGNKRK